MLIQKPFLTSIWHAYVSIIDNVKLQRESGEKVLIKETVLLLRQVEYLQARRWSGAVKNIVMKVLLEKSVKHHK